MYDSRGVREFDFDLYLMKRTPLLKTESVVIQTGSEVNEATYEDALKRLVDSKKVSTWILYVTTPNGIQKIGYRRFIEDIQRIGAWSYVVDPIHKRIIGLTKGKKSKSYNEEVRD